VVAEAGSIEYVYKDGGNVKKGNQINDFFKPSSVDYIGNLPHVRKTILGHSYFTTSPLSHSITLRKALADSASTVNGLNFWQSEYCILGDNAGEINGSKRDLSMDAALYMASVIHADLTAANASSWQWWMAISPYDYKDGLIYVDKNKTGGNFYPSKMMWVLGNYSRFVRPGAIRVDASVSSGDTFEKPILVSAFKNGNEIITVIVNPNKEAVVVGMNYGSGTYLSHLYVTSEDNELKARMLLKNQKNFVISGRSVTTVTGTIR
jgi:hypothetical protein